MPNEAAKAESGVPAYWHSRKLVGAIVFLLALGFVLGVCVALYVIWDKVTEQGGAVAQFNLGIMYNNGQGVPQDDAEAAAWCHKAAEQGHADAQIFKTSLRIVLLR
jgi:TPR repeat protein